MIFIPSHTYWPMLMQYASLSVVGDTVRIHRDQLREGENTVTLTAVSSLRETVLINSTLEVTKVRATPPAPPPLPRQ